jgi:hypothetical protein
MKYIFKFLVLVAIASLFTACGESRYELMLIKEKEKKAQNFKAWKKAGYPYQYAKIWADYKFSYIQAKPWLDIDVIEPKVAYTYRYSNVDVNVVKIWKENGFDTLEDIRPWYNLKIPPKKAKFWHDLGLDASDINGIKYDELLHEIKKQNLTFDEYKLWAKFGLVQPDDIAYFKLKGYTKDNIKNKNAKKLLNNMNNDEFFKFVNIDNIRLQNMYLDHWKYTTNYKRFRNIIHTYYNKQ